MKLDLEKMFGKPESEPVRTVDTKSRKHTVKYDEADLEFKEAMKVVAKYLGNRSDYDFEEKWGEALEVKASKEYSGTARPDWITYKVAQIVSEM
jgi:hypothetical protein